MKSSKALFITFAALSLCACVIVPRVAVAPAFWEEKDKRLVVALAPVPQATSLSTGTGGLLGMAVASSLSSPLKRLVHSYRSTELQEFPAVLTKALRKRGINAVASTQPVSTSQLYKFSNGSNRNIAFLDYRPLVKELKGDLLLLFTVKETVFVHNGYSSMILTGKLVDMKTNQVIWSDLTKSVDVITERWNQPPNYPLVQKSFDTVVHENLEKLYRSLMG